MAGRIKHMERSHRSHRKNNEAVFAQFNRHAFKVNSLRGNAQASKQTIGQRLSSLFKRMMPSKSS